MSRNPRMVEVRTESGSGEERELELHRCRMEHLTNIREEKEEGWERPFSCGDLVTVSEGGDGSNLCPLDITHNVTLS